MYYTPRRNTSQIVMCSCLLASILLLSVVTVSECRSLKEILKGKGRYIPDDCNPVHCNSGSGCSVEKNEVCKEKIIYGDIIVCHCVPYKLADIPIILDLTSNQF